MPNTESGKRAKRADRVREAARGDKKSRFTALLHHVTVELSDWASRFSRVEFLCVHRIFDSAGPRGTRAIVSRVIAFRTRGRRPLPDSQISELNTLPTYTPVQRFECGLTAALAWLGARSVRYSLPV